MLDVRVHNRRVMVQPKSEESAEESLILLPSDAKVEAEWMIATAIDVATEDHAHYVDRDILFPRGAARWWRGATPAWANTTPGGGGQRTLPAAASDNFLQCVK